MAKVRVYELAKELGVESKTLLTYLKDKGEFVRSASSTIEPPVVRSIKESFPPELRGGASGADGGGRNGAGSTGGAAPAPAAGTTAAQTTAAQTTAAGTTAAQTTAAGRNVTEVRPTSGAPGGAPATGGAATGIPDRAGMAARAGGTAPAPSPRPGATSAAPVGGGTPMTRTAPTTAPGRPGSAPAPQRPATQAAPGTQAVPGTAAAAPAARSAAPSPAAPGHPTTPRPAAPAPRPASPGVAAREGGRPGAPQAPGGSRPAPRPGPRPGNNPFAPSQGMGRPAREGSPRPGNNPFAPSQGMPRPQSRPGGVGVPRPGGTGAAGPRPGGMRPNPGMMPDRAAIGRPGTRPGPGGRPGSPAGARPGAPGGFGGRPGGAGRPGGGGRGAAPGAFGRGGGRPVRGRKSRRAKRQEFEQMQAPTIGGVQVPRGDGTQVVRMRRGASLTDFADKIGASAASLVTVLFHLGEMATATQSLDEDTFRLLGAELGYDVQVVSPEDEERELLEQFNIDLEAEREAEGDEDLEPRPPVVTVMGHVDHGKTKLLDAIRSAKVAEGEAGGITQHIGAYQVTTHLEGEERQITFIDTPGHEAFTAMRARGAKVTDIAILVVAADDGVMPQTIEALNHAQAADVPIVVAVNKIDKEGANPEKVRQQLTEYNLVAEEYGGDTMFVNVSARTGENIDALLEAVLLTADAALDLRANPHKDARGVAIETHLDKGRGPVATVLVQSGTLHVGDAIVAGSGFGRVRAMLDEYGNIVTEAQPSRPVLVLGLTSVPGAGDTFLVAPDDRTARQIAERKEAASRAASLARARKRISLEDLNEALAAGKVDTLNLILKGDASGSVEALEDALLQIDVGDEVDLRIIDRGVGAITLNNINLALASNAIIIGFNVRAEGQNAEVADREGVEIRYYSVIYQAIEEIEAALKGMLKPQFEEVRLGEAEVREVFRSSRFGNVAGSLVRSGEIRRGARARVLRDGTVVGDNLEIAGLRRFKDDVTEVREGFECGINLGSFNDLRVGDTVQTFEMREKPRA